MISSGDITNIGIGLAAVAYVVSAIMKARNKQNQDDTQLGIGTIGYFRGQIEGLQALVDQQKKDSAERQKIHVEEMRAVNTKVDTLTGQLQEKEKQLNEYKEIFKGRDPQVLKILQTIQQQNVDDGKRWDRIATFMERMEETFEKMGDKVSLRETGTAADRKQ